MILAWLSFFSYSIDINEDDYEFDIEEITTKLIQLDPSVKDSMWFV